MKKKFIFSLSIILIGIFILSKLLFANQTTNSMSIFVLIGDSFEGSKMVLINGSGYLPADDVAKFFGAELSYGIVSKTALFKFETDSAELKADSDEILVNGEKTTYNKKAYIIDKTFYVPLAFILSQKFKEISGYQIKWNYDKKELKIVDLGTKKRIKKEEKKEEIKQEVKQEIKQEEKKEEIKEEIKEEKIEETKTIEITEQQVLKDNEKIDVKKPINVIVIDPGHGGKDPGAVAPNGVLEKHINLAISKKLATILEEEYKKKVILTRDTDIFIPLAQRAKIANDNKADIFVSIHANAAQFPKSQGFEIYFLSERASDDEAYAVARFENAVISYEEEIDGGVNTILWSMAINEYVNDASALCYFVNEQVKKDIDSYSVKGVRQAGFSVLKGAKMPSALVEVGYVTNPSDLELMIKTTFQTNIAQSIANGILEFEKIESKG